MTDEQFNSLPTTKDLPDAVWVPDLAATPERTSGPVTPEEPLDLEAYYYRFKPTGVRVIDEILHAVAMAGRSFHHTDGWHDEVCGRDSCVGGTPEEWIQNAANKAAAALPRVAPVPLTVDEVAKCLGQIPEINGDDPQRETAELLTPLLNTRGVAPVDVEQAAQPLLEALEEIRMNMQGVLDGAHPHFTKRDLAGAAVHVCERALAAIRTRGDAKTEENRDA